MAFFYAKKSTFVPEFFRFFCNSLQMTIFITLIYRYLYRYNIFNYDLLSNKNVVKKSATSAIRTK